LNLDTLALFFDPIHLKSMATCLSLFIVFCRSRIMIVFLPVKEHVPTTQTTHAYQKEEVAHKQP